MKSNPLPESELGQKFFEKYRLALTEIHKEVLGLDEVIEQIFIAILADGHVVLEGEPGVGKTLVVNTIARTIAADCKRIQFTSETMPSHMYFSLGGFDQNGIGVTLREMKYVRGPLYTQILIGDEINRATPHAQSALIEPLEEKQITLEGTTTPLGNFYFFAATQNPVEAAESTYELPEALRERLFLMVRVPYPSPELLRKIAVHDTRKKQIDPIFSPEELVQMQNAILEEYVLKLDSKHPVIGHIQRLITAVHDHPAVRWGPGIRAAQDLTRAAAVHAFLRGREHLAFEDVHEMAHPVLRFKFERNPQKSRQYGVAHNDEVISEVLQKVPIAAEEGK